MIRSFADSATKDIYHGLATGRARDACPAILWRVARRKLDQLHRAQRIADLAVPPGNRLERLSGERSGFYSVRINRQFRICFTWQDGDAHDVEITDYH